MKAVVRRNGALVEADIPEVSLAEGQVLVKTLACGICGSDLHALHHLDHMVEMGVRAGAPDTLDPSADLVMGHEFCGEILDHGPGTTARLKAGTRVVSTPFAFGPLGPELIGFSTRYPGGFGERMALTEALLLEVPNGLSADEAAMTEPMAVGLHAVDSADLSRKPVALVIGCGPVGLAVIAALKRRGIGPIVAADYAEGRRALAERMGADIVVDPAQTSPHEHWQRFEVAATLAELGLGSMTGRTFREAVIFECVGVPGVIQSIIEQGPPLAQVIIVGACQEDDRILPTLAISKQLSFKFVFAYSPDEFAQTLGDIAEGRVDVTPLISGSVGRSGVGKAFDDLSRPGTLAKIMVKPAEA
ncbi:MAG: zinc-binding dehydrogenase [Sphingobium sp.]